MATSVPFTSTSYTAEQMKDPTFFANYVRESIQAPAAKTAPATTSTGTRVDNRAQESR